MRGQGMERCPGKEIRTSCLHILPPWKIKTKKEKWTGRNRKLVWEERSLHTHMFCIWLSSQWQAPSHLRRSWQGDMRRSALRDLVLFRCVSSPDIVKCLHGVLKTVYNTQAHLNTHHHCFDNICLTTIVTESGDFCMACFFFPSFICQQKSCQK